MEKQFIEVKTAELIGPALDWAVQMSVWTAGGHVHEENAAALREGAIAVSKEFKYSTNWSESGPLIDKYCSALNKGEIGWWSHAGDRLGEGDTALVALCRAVAATKLGDVVRIPVELLGGAA